MMIIFLFVKFAILIRVCTWRIYVKYLRCLKLLNHTEVVCVLEEKEAFKWLMIIAPWLWQVKRSLFSFNCCLKYGHLLENADINATYVDTRRLAKSIIWIFHLYGQMIIKTCWETFRATVILDIFLINKFAKNHELEIYLIISSIHYVDERF